MLHLCLPDQRLLNELILFTQTAAQTALLSLLARGEGSQRVWLEGKLYKITIDEIDEDDQ